MKRNVDAQLKNLIENEKPLLVYGMRGVGKTHILTEYVTSNKRQYIYINLANDGLIRENIAAGAQSNKSFLEILADNLNYEYNAIREVLVILDNVEYSTKIIKLLQRDIAEHKNLVIIADYVTDEVEELRKLCVSLKINPLSFGEFLDATDHEWYREVIEGHTARAKKIPQMIHDDISELYEDFLVTGGLMLPVLDYISSGTTDNTQTMLRKSYNDIYMGLRDILEDSEFIKASAIISSIVAQAGENYTRFSFSSVRRGTTFNYYKKVLKLLEESGIIRTIQRLGGNSFKLYICETGLFSYLEESNGIAQDSLYYLRVLTTTINELTANGHKCYFWQSPSHARLDLVIDKEQELLPIDIVSSTAHSKSISSFLKTHNTSHSIRLWEHNFDTTEKSLSAPYYSVFCPESL